MRVQLTAEEFRVLEGALDAADPGPGKDGDAPVPQEVITAIRYKLLDAESSRNYGLDLTGEEGNCSSPA
jgi:hypothetical protein